MTYQFKNITVLVVDSSPAMVELIQGVLHMLGVRKILTRTDGKSGLQAFERHNPDLMIIDWDLKNLDGIAFTKKVRKSRHPFTPIIFMTVFSSEKKVQEARDSGVTEFLKKPFSAKQLYRRIEEIIERPRQFVRADDFFGPDRRRRTSDDFTGINKRAQKPIDRGAISIDIDFVESPLPTPDKRK